MSEQPEALRLAEALEQDSANHQRQQDINSAAAVELCRLRRSNEALRALNAELVEALRSIAAGGLYDFESAEAEARAALSKAEGAS